MANSEINFFGFGPISMRDQKSAIVARINLESVGQPSKGFFVAFVCRKSL